MSIRQSSPIIVLLGAPGSGKGTQGAWLSEKLGIPTLSTGEMLRFEAKRNTAEGCTIRQVLATGSLVSDELVCSVLGNRLLQPHDGLILDGFPRTFPQAEFLNDLLAGLGLESPTVFHLVATVESLLERLTARRQCSKCGAIYNLGSRPSKRGRLCEVDYGALVQRDDDSEGVILHRFREYSAMSAPLVEFYADRNYFAVNAERDPQEVSAELLGILSRREAMAA